MPRLTVIRYSTKPEASDENERLSRAVFDEARERMPKGIAYAMFRDGDDWVYLFVNRQEDTTDILTQLPSFRAYSAGVADRCVAPPEATPFILELRDHYGFAD